MAKSSDKEGKPQPIVRQQPNVITLPGNSTKTDLVEIMKMAASIVRNPWQFSESNKQGCAVALDIFVAGIN